MQSASSQLAQVVCLYEDRPTDLVGLKLLILSLEQYSPDVPIYVFFPTATYAFRQWLAQHPQAQLQTLEASASGWN
jgi:hypothetical protein